MHIEESMPGCREDVFHLLELVIVRPAVKAVNDAGNQALHTVFSGESSADVILLDGDLIE